MENVKQPSCPLRMETTTEEQALKVYYGYGNHNIKGDVIYNISLPTVAQNNICIQKIIELENNVLFIWIKGGTKPYTNSSNNMLTLHFNIYEYMEPVPKIKETKEFYLVHFFHEDTMSETDILNDMKNIITTHCTLTYKMDNKDKEIDIPEQCGNGVLTLQ